MNTSLIVSVIGPDRPGLVEQISTTVAGVGGNWEGSRMIQLAEQFAGMVQVVLPEDRVDELRASLARLESDDLQISVIHAGEASATSSAPAQRILLEVVGQDRNGIVAAISRTLAAAGVNVVELATDCRNAPWSGDKVFQTNAILEVPAGSEVPLDELREKVEEIAGDLMVEIKPEVV
jgi:glycine cleavage system regulatory protein